MIISIKASEFFFFKNTDLEMVSLCFRGLHSNSKSLPYLFNESIRPFTGYLFFEWLNFVTSPESSWRYLSYSAGTINRVKRPNSAANFENFGRGALKDRVFVSPGHLASYGPFIEYLEFLESADFVV